MALDNRVAWDPNENVGRSSAGTFKVRPHGKGKKFVIEFELKKAEPDPELRTNLTRLLDAKYDCIQHAVIACQTASDNVCKRCVAQTEQGKRGREQDVDERRESTPSESKRGGRKGKSKRKGKKAKAVAEAAKPEASKPEATKVSKAKTQAKTKTKTKAKAKAKAKATKKATPAAAPATPATTDAPRKRGRPAGSKDSVPRQKRSSGAPQETAPRASKAGKPGKKPAGDDLQQARDALKEIGKDFDVD